MTASPLPSDPGTSSSPQVNQSDQLDLPGVPEPQNKGRFSSRFVNVDRRSPSNTVFVVDETTFTSTVPKATHWSIAWSDLMMTMFILFLSMYVYQTANQKFLQETDPEVIGGDTTEALQTLDSSGANFPFNPIYPGVPLMTSGTVKKIERVEVDTLDPDSAFLAKPPEQDPAVESERPIPTEQRVELEESTKVEQSAIVVEKEQSEAKMMDPAVTKTDDIIEPQPLPVEEKEPVRDQFKEIYTMSQGALKENNLDKFASIDLIPDKTMRIILTGDLLFELGESNLSQDAQRSLRQLTSFIQDTPYMINVVGHTDNIPMHSARYASNWELSVARASTVARFLIDEMNIPPNQFVVSGYASYRPIRANTTSQNRAKNRRVEIIISKRLPQPLPANGNNLQ